MGWLDSFLVVGAMARETVPSLVDAARGRLTRETIDERTHRFGRYVIERLGIQLHVEGVERVPPGRAYVYMSNHQSHLDIPVLYATLPSPTIRMVGKKELFDIPVWGPALRAAEFIEIDRGDREQAIGAMKRAAELVEDGVSMYLAPEGTRSRDGRLSPLKKGGFHLAVGTGAPIVPVAIRGTIDVLARGTKKMHTGMPVVVIIGDPIEVDGRTPQDLREEVGRWLKIHVEDEAPSPGRAIVP
ncbi:MAG TPA: lysophospholipid acyltransferase family protein [Kofleriaceae bacterium]|nr:lysophospholipid acyltransferase family protein [Kofleriaceae bacterium]